MKKLIGFYNPGCLLPIKLNFKKTIFPSDQFFLSFGDALLSLINHFNLNKSNIALLPNFYCPETADWLSRKMKVVFYKINSDFCLNKESYTEQIKKYSPDLIINYTFTGIFLSKQEKNDLKKIIKDTTIVIEDSAHQNLITNFEKIYPRHFGLDSIRKHSPFLGSHLIGTCDGKKFERQPINAYKIKLTALQWLRNRLDLLCVLTGWEFFNTISDKVFLVQDEIVGNNPKPSAGWTSSFFLYNHIDWPKINRHKNELAYYFSQKLNSLNLPGIYALPNEIAESAKMNYLPIFVEKKKKEALLDYLNENRIFADVLWEIQSTDNQELAGQKLYDDFIIYPLTWLIKENDIDDLINKLMDFSKK